MHVRARQAESSGMSTSIIVLDTNILTRSPFLDSGEWTQLHDHTTDWGLSFTVPEVVFMETVNVVRREWKPELTRLEQISTSSWGRRLDTELQAVVDAAVERSEGYESSLRSRMEELGIAITPLPTTIDHLDIARRASERRAPYGSAGSGKDEYLKDGYRDTLIWLTVLKVAENHPNCDVWFVSDNYSDFGGKREKKDTRDTSDYPLAWHSELIPELASKGLIDRVFYARGLGRLEEHLLAKFAPLSDAEREELWEALDRSELDRHLIQTLFTTSVEPRAAALPLDTSSATIISSVRASDAIQFTEAARRAANTWTARFNCDIAADVEVTTFQGDVSVESKPLIISGRIDVNSQNEVATLTIDAIDAIADDPQRRAWERVEVGERFARKLLAGFNQPPDTYLNLISGFSQPNAYQNLISDVNRTNVHQKFLDGLNRTNVHQEFIDGLNQPPDKYRATSGTTPDKPEEPDDSPDVKPGD